MMFAQHHWSRRFYCALQRCTHQSTVFDGRAARLGSVDVNFAAPNVGQDGPLPASTQEHNLGLRHFCQGWPEASRLARNLLPYGVKRDYGFQAA
jgi:hypothetical protein